MEDPELSGSALGLTVHASKALAYIQFVLCIVFAAIAVFAIAQGGMVLGAVFGIAALGALALGTAQLRSRIIFENESLTIHSLFVEKSVNMSALASAHVVMARGYNVYLKDGSGQWVKFSPIGYNKSDMKSLMLQLKPFIMADGVERDENTAKLLQDYAPTNGL